MKTCISTFSYEQAMKKGGFTYFDAIDYTKKLLRDGELSLTEIANMLNMSSVHYLTALFKKHEKISPTEYMRSVKKDFE